MTLMKTNNINKNDLVEIDKWIISEAIKLHEEIQELNDNYAYHHVIQKFIISVFMSSRSLFRHN